MTKNEKAPHALLTVAEVALRLNASEKTIRRLIDSKQLPVIRCGRLLRIHPDDLERFIAAHRFA
jgi:excisionase family DNA binding protein